MPGWVRVWSQKIGYGPTDTILGPISLYHIHTMGVEGFKIYEIPHGFSYITKLKVTGTIFGGVFGWSCTCMMVNFSMNM